MSLKAMTPLRGRGPSPFFPLALIHRRLAVFVCCQKGFIYAAAGGVCPMIRKAPGSLLGTPRAMLDDVCDLCLMDTVSYNEEHRVDFCCLQAPVAL